MSHAVCQFCNHQRIRCPIFLEAGIVPAGDNARVFGLSPRRSTVITRRIHHMSAKALHSLDKQEYE